MDLVQWWFIKITKRMKRINFKYQIAAGVTLLLVGTLLLFSNYIKDKRDVVFSEMNLVLSSMDIGLIEEIPEEASEEVEDTPEEVIEEDNNNYTYEEYLGVIDIPKINLYKGFYDKTSNLNNVKFNLFVLSVSAYPDIERGNLIIAGHSGNYSNSYFGKLYLLETGDDITIHYNNKKYIYEISKIYYENKDGNVRILRDNSKTTLTLITCTKDSNSSQTIYIAYLKEVE